MSMKRMESVGGNVKVWQLWPRLFAKGGEFVKWWWVIFKEMFISCCYVRSGAASLARASLTERLWLSFWAGVFIYHTKLFNVLAVSSAEEDCCVQEDVPQEDSGLCSSWEEMEEPFSSRSTELCLCLWPAFLQADSRRLNPFYIWEMQWMGL